jgi:hypothetical protein
MRVINAETMIYRCPERLPVAEHVVYLNSRVGEWQDYHLPLTNASSQRATAPPKTDLDSRYAKFVRFDYNPESPVKAVPPVDQVIIEMKDFRAVTLP